MTSTADTWGWRSRDVGNGRAARETAAPPRGEPIPLSSGPMRWSSPIPSRDGRKIFVSGLIQRGELVRWDGAVPSNALLPWRHFSRICGLLKGWQVCRIYVVSRRDSLEEQHRWQRTGPADAAPGLFQIASLVTRWHADLFNDLVPPGQLVMYVIPSRGGTPQRLLPEDNGPQMDPNWSPDGRKVVFSSSGSAYRKS